MLGDDFNINAIVIFDRKRREHIAMHYRGEIREVTSKMTLTHNDIWKRFHRDLKSIIIYMN